MSYTHLSLRERYQIYALIGAKHSIKFIADALGKSPSTISREIRRNKSLRSYRANHANNKTSDRRSNNATTIVAEFWAWVTDKLKESWSPEQTGISKANYNLYKRSGAYDFINIKYIFHFLSF